MDREVIELELSAEERALILRYGEPFDRVKESLEACSDSKPVKRGPMDLFELERLIGGPSISINDMQDTRMHDELADLCGRLETVERYGDGRLDWI